MHAARAVADDLDLDVPRGGFLLDRGCDLIGATGDGCRVTRNVNADAHQFVSAKSSSSLAESIRATSSPSSMAEGDKEQRPRQ